MRYPELTTRRFEAELWHRVKGAATCAARRAGSPFEKFAIHNFKMVARSASLVKTSRKNSSSSARASNLYGFHTNRFYQN